MALAEKHFMHIGADILQLQRMTKWDVLSGTQCTNEFHTTPTESAE